MHVQEEAHLGDLSGKEGAVRIGHLGPDGECSGVGVHLRVSEVHEALHRILRVVGQGDGHVGIPLAGGILLSEIDVPLAALEVVERCHAEIHLDGVALDNGGEQGLSSGTHQGSEVHVPLADVSRYGRTYGGIAKGYLGLGEVSLAHDHLGLGALVGGNGVVQVQTAGGILLEEGTDTLQVSLCLELRPDGWRHSARRGDGYAPGLSLP